MKHCTKEVDGVCKKCENNWKNTYCLNSEFGCIETIYLDCLECDDYLDFNKCTKCMEGYELDENGLCIDEEACTSKVGGVCKSCREDWGYLCLNDIFGCVEGSSNHCLECNEILELSKCTKCKSGYVLNDFNECE